jgi:hypothetical protein
VALEAMAGCLVVLMHEAVSGWRDFGFLHGARQGNMSAAEMKEGSTAGVKQQTSFLSGLSRRSLGEGGSMAPGRPRPY